MTKRLGRKGFAALAARPLCLAIGRGLTFTWVGFTLLWFWADWPQLQQLAQTLGAPAILLGAVALAATATVVLTAVRSLQTGAFSVAVEGQPVLTSRYVRTAWVTLLVIIVVGVQVVLQAPAPDVVYKNF